MADHAGHFKPGNPGGPGRLPKPKRTNHAGIRLTREDLAAAKDGAHLLRWLSTIQDRTTADRMQAAARAIERIHAQWTERRQTHIDRYDRPLKPVRKDHP